MDNSMQAQANQQPTDPNATPLVTPTERQNILQRFINAARWNVEMANKVESEAFKNSQGNRVTYMKLINQYYQVVQARLQGRSAQPNPNPNGTAAAATPTPSLVRPTQPTNVSTNYSYAGVPPAAAPPGTATPTRMVNPPAQPMNRLSQPMSFPSATSNISTNMNDFSAFPNRFPTVAPNHLLRPRTATAPNTNISFPSPTISVDPNAAFLPTNSTVPVNSLPGDHVLNHVLNAGATSTFATRMGIPARPPTATISTRPMRPVVTNPTPLRQPSTSIVTLPSTSQTSTVPLAPTNMMSNPIVPTQNLNPTAAASINRPMINTSEVRLPRPITSPDNDVINLIKFLKENVDRLTPHLEKFMRENNLEKVRQIQGIQQQIHHFVNNPTHEALPSAKRFSGILEQLASRAAAAVGQTATNVSHPPTNAAPVAVPAVPVPAPAPAPVPVPVSVPVRVPTPVAAPPAPVKPIVQPPLSVFDQCSKSAREFLQRDPKDRRTIGKRYLEPLNDVINGVPHKILRLDFDQNGKTRHRSTNSSTFLSLINEEINRLPAEISVERPNLSRTMKSPSTHQQEKSGLTLRCKFLSHSNPIVPPLVLHLSSSYPEQAPVILSLTKSPTPKLDFAEGNAFLEKISNIFVANLFQLAREHTITDILNIWRQSVQTAL